MRPKVNPASIVFFSLNKAFKDTRIGTAGACGADVLLAESEEEIRRREEVIEEDVVCRFW